MVSRFVRVISMVVVALIFIKYCDSQISSDKFNDVDYCKGDDPQRDEDSIIKKITEKCRSAHPDFKGYCRKAKISFTDKTVRNKGELLIGMCERKETVFYLVTKDNGEQETAPVEKISIVCITRGPKFWEFDHEHNACKLDSTPWTKDMRATSQTAAQRIQDIKDKIFALFTPADDAYRSHVKSMNARLNTHASFSD